MAIGQNAGECLEPQPEFGTALFCPAIDSADAGTKSCEALDSSPPVDRHATGREQEPRERCGWNRASDFQAWMARSNVSAVTSSASS